MVARCTRKSRARSAALFRPEPRPSRISAFCSGVSFGWRPPCRPRTAAAFRPARVRSRTMARSNSAKRPSICIRMRPAGPALSIASVSERKRAPTASTLSRMCSRSVSERDRRSSFHTTSGVARPQLIEQAVQLGPVPAPTRRRVLEHPFAAGALERPDLGGGILTVVRLGNPCIVEEHGPVSHFPVANELTLATGLCTRQALAPQPCCINVRTPLAKSAALGWAIALDGFLVRRSPMSLRLLQLVPSVPDDTARIARAAFPRGNPYVLLRNRLGPVFDDTGFADLYPQRGQPAYTPWRLALVTLLQFREGLSDRQAAEAVRARIDWKYLLALDLADAGFDHTVLCTFRGRLLAGDASERLLARVLDTARDAGLLKARGRQRTDSTHVLAAVRDLNRIELVAETLRAALNAIAGVAPDWLRALAPPEWHERYDRRIEDIRLPKTGPKREAYVAQVGADGFLLLDAIDTAAAPPATTTLPAVAVLRRVWARHFEREEPGPDNGETSGDGVRLRPVQGRGPGDRIQSPYDPDSRFRSKAGMRWTGYMVHLTETCDEDAPRLVVHTDTTPANVHEAVRTAPIHEALAGKGLDR